MATKCLTCANLIREVEGSGIFFRHCSVAITPKLGMTSNPEDTWKYCNKYQPKEIVSRIEQKEKL